MNTEPQVIPHVHSSPDSLPTWPWQSEGAQGLTYPLVAIVASWKGEPLNLAGLAQSNTLLFMLGTLGFGLVATGMVFEKPVKALVINSGLSP